MTTIQMILGILLVVVSIALTIIVLIQRNRQSDASAVNGGSSDFFGKTQGHQKDAVLSKTTIVTSTIMAVLIVATTIVLYFNI